MASFQIFFVSTFFFVLNTASSAKICKTTYCDDLNRFPLVEFPFQLSATSHNKRCGYPGFNLSCNNRSQTILTFPHSGDFVVQGINYLEQSMYIEDPDGCFPRRFLTQNFTLSGTPFQLSETSKNYTFYNCSKEKSYEYAAPVSCLRGDNFKVLVTFYPESELQQQCQEIMYAPIDKVELSWFEPGCGVCVRGSQECALISDDSLEVGCFDVATATPSNGILRSVEYGLTIGVGIGLLCFIGLTCCLCNRDRLNSQRPNTQLSTSTVPQQAAFVMGLDGCIIESYPKTFLGESRELPNPNDNTCSICLSEYQPKEILRTIPECNHYFHANCIDEWLKINAACPICRNSPN